MTRRLAAVGAVVAILMVAWVGWKGSPPALAHALLVRSDPPVNAQLREAPKAITMYFSEAVEQKISTARVVDGNNKRVDTGVEFDSQDNALMKVNVGPMPPGYYTVVWATLSKVDGHRISGSFPITVLNPDGSKPAGQAPTATGGTTSGGGAKPDRALTKWLLLISGSAVLGGLAFAWVSSSFSGASGEEATAAAGNRIIATAVIAILALGVFGLVELAIQADTLGGLGKVGDVFSTQWGTRWLIRNTLLVPLLLVVLVLSRARKRLWHARPLLFAAMALVLAYLVLVSSVSHSAAGAGAAWATSSDFLHLTAASLWTGLLLQLGLTLRWVNSRVARPERPVLIASVLQRFSLIAVLSVAILLFTGTLNAIFDVGSFSDLINSSYGEALLIKLIVIVPLLAAGGFNAYVYRPRILAETADERGRPDLSALGSLEQSLRRTVLVEGGLVVLVLLVVGVLVQLPPTRAGIAAPKNVAGKYTATKNVPDLSVTLVVNPNEAGDNSFETYLTGAAASVQRVQLRFIDKSKRLPESDLVMDPSNPPIFYVGRGPYLSQGGDWQILVDLRRNTGSDVAVPFDVTVAGATGLDTGRGGGSWAWPRSLSASSLALLIAATFGTLALVVASWPRADLPAGRMGVLANRVVRIHVRPSISLSIIVVLGIGLGILLGAHSHSKLSSSAAAEGNPIKSSPESIARGMQLFMANCTQCHGESGRGDGPLAASLPIKPANLYDHIPYHPDQFFYGLMTNGLSGIMPAFGSSISDDDRWNILNYLRSQFGQPPPTQ